jgi:hypothetical protein
MEKELLEKLNKHILINPAKMTLKHLATQNLHLDKPLEIIKKNAAVAQKEFAIK